MLTAAATMSIPAHSGLDQHVFWLLACRLRSAPAPRFARGSLHSVGEGLGAHRSGPVEDPLLVADPPSPRGGGVQLIERLHSPVDAAIQGDGQGVRDVAANLPVEGRW